MKTTDATQIRRAKTADNKILVLWSDGHLTQVLGVYIDGIGKPRNVSLALLAANRVMDLAGEFEMSEIPTLYHCSRKAEDRQDLRERFLALPKPKQRLS